MQRRDDIQTRKKPPKPDTETRMTDDHTDQTDSRRKIVAS